ncbi:MAG: 2-dehydropantoate 2-reductase [Desulfobacterales bacterium]
MKIAVVGAGAMGSLFGALLAEAGRDVWLYDVWAEHVRAVNQNGLKIEREGNTRTVRVNAATDPARIDGADLVIIFVKSTQTEAAAETARRIAGPEGMVMTLQNGMGNADTIARSIAADRVLAGTTSHGATMLGAGRIRHAGIGPTIIGSWAATGLGRQRAQKIADYFNSAGIETQAVSDVHSVVWNKLLINIGINAVTALCGIKNGQLLDLTVTRGLSRRAVEEAMAVARARHVEINKDAVNIVFKVAEATAANRSSMGQDVDNKRRTEIAAINGFIVQEANRLGLEAPINFALTALIETLQSHY